MKTVTLEFTRPFGPYATGDSAGFATEAAERYLELGVAKRTSNGGRDEAHAKPQESTATASTANAAEIAAVEQDIEQEAEGGEKAAAALETAEQSPMVKPKATKGKAAKE